MKKYTDHCDYCEKEFNNDKNGFKVEIGYSTGGWGSRRDYVHNKSVEICNKCFSSVTVKVLEMDKCIQELKGDSGSFSRPLEEMIKEMRNQPITIIPSPPTEVFLVQSYDIIYGCFDTEEKAMNYKGPGNYLTISKLKVQ